MPWTNKQVLIIGDSLSDGTSTPGKLLAERLEAAGAQVRIQAKVGRSAYHFVTYQDGLRVVATEIAEHRPDLVLIILGTNDLSLGVQPTRSAFAKIKAAFDRAGIPTYHVGPPAFAQTSLNTSAENIVKIGRELFGGRFIDARPMTQDILTSAQGRAGDLIHFQPAGARAWAARLADALTRAVEGPAVATEEPGGTRSRLYGFLGVGAVAALGALAFILVRRTTLDRRRDRWFTRDDARGLPSRA